MSLVRSLRGWILMGVAVLVLAGHSALVAAAELSVAPLAEGAPAEELSPEIAARLRPEGYQVKSGTRILCDIWLAKDWALKPDFKPSNSVKYPLEMGQFIGVVQYRRKGEDFRGQEIEKGLYTMRFALQPEDGNHVGTSDTLDFLLLLKAEVDRAPATVSKEQLFKLSAQAAGTTHPCMLSLLAPGGQGSTDAELEHDESREWWILQCVGRGMAAGQGSDFALRVVVDGKSAE